MWYRTPCSLPAEVRQNVASEFALDTNLGALAYKQGSPRNSGIDVISPGACQRSALARIQELRHVGADTGYSQETLCLASSSVELALNVWRPFCRDVSVLGLAEQSNLFLPMGVVLLRDPLIWCARDILLVEKMRGRTAGA